MNLQSDVSQPGSCPKPVLKVEALLDANGAPSASRSSESLTTEDKLKMIPFVAPRDSPKSGSIAGDDEHSTINFQKSMREFFQSFCVAEFACENTKILVVDTRVPLHIAILSLFEYNKPFATVYDELEGAFVGFVDANELIDFFCHLYVYLNVADPSLFFQSLPRPLIPTQVTSSTYEKCDSTISLQDADKRTKPHHLRATRKDSGSLIDLSHTPSSKGIPCASSSSANPSGIASSAACQSSNASRNLLGANALQPSTDGSKPCSEEMNLVASSDLSCASIDQIKLEGDEEGVEDDACRSKHLKNHVEDGNYVDSAKTHGVSDATSMSSHKAEDVNTRMAGGAVDCAHSTSSHPPFATVSSEITKATADNYNLIEAIDTATHSSAELGGVSGGKANAADMTINGTSSACTSSLNAGNNGSMESLGGTHSNASNDDRVAASRSVNEDEDASNEDSGVCRKNWFELPSSVVQPPWLYTIDQWRYINKSPRSFSRINVDRTALDALKALLENDVSGTIIWNEDRSAPLSFITVSCLARHLIKNLRGNFIQFDQLVRTDLKIGTYDDLVSVVASTPIHKVLKLFREKNLSVIPIVDITGSYLGSFTKNHFMQLVFNSLTDESAIDADAAIYTLWEKLNQSPPAGNIYSNNGIYSQQNQVSPALVAYGATKRYTSTASSLASFSVPQEAITPLSGAAQSSGGSTSLPCALPSPPTSSTNATPQLYSPAVLEEDILLREAIVRALLAEEHRIFFLDRNMELQGVVTLSDICKYLIGWGNSALDVISNPSPRILTENSSGGRIEGFPVTSQENLEKAAPEVVLPMKEHEENNG